MYSCQISEDRNLSVTTPMWVNSIWVNSMWVSPKWVTSALARSDIIRLHSKRVIFPSIFVTNAQRSLHVIVWKYKLQSVLLCYSM